MTTGDRVAAVTHYYTHLHVAVLRLDDDLHLGDLVHILGAHTDFGQEITSIQIDHHPVTWAATSQEVAVQVRHRVRAGDLVYRVSDISEDESPEWFGDLVPEE
jgi:hypothetical protein